MFYCGVHKFWVLVKMLLPPQFLLVLAIFYTFSTLGIRNRTNFDVSILGVFFANLVLKKNHNVHHVSSLSSQASSGHQPQDNQKTQQNPRHLSNWRQSPERPRLFPNPGGLSKHVGVSENSGTPKSSILIGFSIINHPFWGTPIFGNTHVKKKGRRDVFLFRTVESESFPRGFLD